METFISSTLTRVISLISMLVSTVRACTKNPQNSGDFHTGRSGLWTGPWTGLWTGTWTETWRLVSLQLNDFADTRGRK